MDAENAEHLNIFLTGGSTPLGLAVTQRLTALGHKVSGITNNKEGAGQIRGAGGLPVYSDPRSTGEIRAMLTMCKASVVVHLAGASGLPFRATLDAGQVREEAAALVDAVEGVGVQYMVALSYAFLYAGYDGGHAAHGHGGHSHSDALEVADEDAPLIAPGDDALLRAAYFADQAVQDANLPVCVLRTGYMYGPTMPDTVLLGEMLRAGRPIAMGDRHANWVFMDDLADAVVLAVTRPAVDTTYNIVDDAPASPAAFLQTFSKAMGLNAPARMPGFIGRALSSKATTTLLDLSSAASNARAKSELRWSPKYATHEKGIDQTLFMWRSEMRVSR